MPGGGFGKGIGGSYKGGGFGKGVGGSYKGGGFGKGVGGRYVKGSASGYGKSAGGSGGGGGAKAFAGGGPSAGMLTGYIKQASTLEALFETFSKHAARFNHVHFAACWSALGRLARGAGRSQAWTEEHREALRALVRRTSSAVDAPVAGCEFRARELATTAHGAAKSGASAGELMAALARGAERRVGDCNAQEMANLAYAFAKAQHEAPELLDAIAEHARPRLGEFKAQELSNLAWAYATAKRAAPALLDAIAEQARPRLREFNEQALSNTLWAYASAKHEAPALFDAIAEQTIARPSELTPQALSTIAWACASAKHCPAQLLDAIAKEARPRLREFSAQQLSNSVWAFAKADHADPELYAALAAAVARRLGDFNPQDLASTAMAFAKACHVDAQLFASLARAAETRADESNLQDLVSTAWAFAKVGQFDTGLYAALSRSLIGRRLDELDAPHIANVAWAFSKATQTPDVALFAALARTATHRVGDFGAQDLATIAWSFANADQLETRLFAALAKSAERLLDKFSAEDRDNAEWAFVRAGQQRIVKLLRQQKARGACGPTSLARAPDVDVGKCGRIVVAGGGIGGAAAAVALQNKGFDVVVLEGDASFDARKQGYGLTIQQQEATQALGISLAQDDAPSTSHYTFDAAGNILGFFGEAFGSASKDRRECENSGRFVHIPRQVLRCRLLERVRPGTIRWGSKLKSFKCWSEDDGGGENNENGVTVTLADGTTLDAALLVGSDGIFSTVRKQLDLKGDRLNYVGLIVVLGIVPTECGSAGDDSEGRQDGHAPAMVSPLTHRRIFETVDGAARIYAMPFTTTSTMWQLSFPFPEKQARALAKDTAALKDEILRRCGSWHAPIPDLLRSTPLDGMAGYPVYDRQLLEPHVLREPEGPATQLRPQRRATLIGDAAHPMTPFKAQGANQALSDAVLLADSLVESIQRHGPSAGMDAALPLFEKEMLRRSSRMVVGSREKAKELHSPLALQPARKVQRDTLGGLDMQKSIGILLAKGIGAHSAADPLGLDAVVEAAISSLRRKRSVPATAVADVEKAGSVRAATKKRRANNLADQGEEGGGEPADDGKANDDGGFKWRRTMRKHLDAAGDNGVRRKDLRKATLRDFQRHLSKSKKDGVSADVARKRWMFAEPAELDALFRSHLAQAEAAGRLSTRGKMVYRART